MSTPARPPEQEALRRAAGRSAAARSRRADDGALTEMARSLLRDARAARGAEGAYRAASARLDRIARGSRRRRVEAA
ncbi:MAG TPA: hypothetical protein VHY83_08660 [Solirubrobacteraceae bacterium]|jgi:hypothetical protein|nr:hypothetical protein [Solirubrobacteraceae bacterium]